MQLLCARLSSSLEDTCAGTLQFLESGLFCSPNGLLSAFGLKDRCCLDTSMKAVLVSSVTTGHMIWGLTLGRIFKKAYDTREQNQSGSCKEIKYSQVKIASE